MNSIILQIPVITFLSFFLFFVPILKPVPKTRKRYITDNTLPVKPLETPSKNVLTPPNKEVTPAPIVDHHSETNTKTEELQEMSWEQLFDAVLSPYDNDEGENLPQEYSSPPPFAPGYQTKEAWRRRHSNRIIYRIGDRPSERQNPINVNAQFIHASIFSTSNCQRDCVYHSWYVGSL